MSRVFIIAEAGVNHNGNMDLAKKLVNTAKECGADCVKFQTAKLDSLVSKNASMAEYQKDNTGRDVSQRDMLEEILLSYNDFVELSKYCREKEIEFLSTPFDIDSIRFLDSIVRVWKIPSGEITNLPYLREIAKTNKKVIMSTGMSTMKEVDEAVNVLYKYGTKELILLHCTTDYPTDFMDVNLKAMLSLKEKFHVPVGYSDHTEGIEASVAAVAMGAEVIEKHFTLNKNMKGPDHKASLEPDELKAMVKAVRNIEKALGDGQKKPTEAEKANMAVVRKSILAKTVIEKGALFTEENITTKRPGTGMSPMLWDSVVGTAAKRKYEEDELIEL